MVVYRDGRLFKASELSTEEDPIHNEELGRLNSFVISASIGGKKIQGLKNKVKTVFTPLQVCATHIYHIIFIKIAFPTSL